MRICMIAFGACAALAASTANGHGPQIQVTNTSSKIVTRELIPAGPYGNSLTAPKSVYVIPILQAITGNPSTAYWQVMPNSDIDPILSVSAYQFGPGLAYGFGHTFDAGQHFNVNFTDSLKRWNGANFAANPGPEEIGAFRGDSTSPADTAFTTNSGPFQGLVFNNISATYNAESHSSMRFRVLGDGASALVEPQDGLYLLQLQITSTQPSLAASDPFYFLLYKNASPSSLNSAVLSLGIDPSLVQFLPIPEPRAAVLAVVGLIGLLYFPPRPRRKLT
jgi:hypothetical protein